MSLSIPAGVCEVQATRRWRTVAPGTYSHELQLAEEAGMFGSAHNSTGARFQQYCSEHQQRRRPSAGMRLKQFDEGRATDGQYGRGWCRLGLRVSQFKVELIGGVQSYRKPFRFLCKCAHIYGEFDVESHWQVGRLGNQHCRTNCNWCFGNL